ncbi:hypothetical protein Tco_1240457 [Tanacetum coccineum]
MMLYKEGVGMIVNFIIALRHSPLPPKHTSSSTFPNVLTCSPENPDTVVCISTNLDLIDGCSILKQCSNMISIDDPSSMCILRTRYPSTSASTTKASFERSHARTSGKVIGTSCGGAYGAWRSCALKQVYVLVYGGCSRKGNIGSCHSVSPTVLVRLSVGIHPLVVLCFRTLLPTVDKHPLFLISHPQSWVYYPRNVLPVPDIYGNS